MHVMLQRHWELEQQHSAASCGSLSCHPLQKRQLPRPEDAQAAEEGVEQIFLPSAKCMIYMEIHPQSPA